MCTTLQLRIPRLSLQCCRTHERMVDEENPRTGPFSFPTSFSAPDTDSLDKGRSSFLSAFASFSMIIPRVSS